MDYEIIGTIQEPNLTKCLNDMLYKKLNSLATCDYLLNEKMVQTLRNKTKPYSSGKRPSTVLMAINLLNY